MFFWIFEENPIVILWEEEEEKNRFFQYFPIFSIHSDPNKNGFGPFIDGILGFRKKIVVTSHQFWYIDMMFLPS